MRGSRARTRRPDPVPLDPLQERIARTALALPEARTLALPGGGAMIAHGFVTRETKDIDLFTEIDDARHGVRRLNDGAVKTGSPARPGTANRRAPGRPTPRRIPAAGAPAAPPNV